MKAPGRATAGRGLLLLACLLVRLAAPDADPPAWLSWSTGLNTDEGFYTLDARHEALFGTLALGDFHDRLLSPLLSVTQQGVFTIFGVGLVPARLLSVAFGLLTVAVFRLALRRAYDAETADWGALFLGLVPVFALYNRLALQETPTVFWLVLAFALWAGGRQTWSGAALAVAVVFKGLALLALPAFVTPPAPTTTDGGGAGKEPGRVRGLLSYPAPPLLGAGGAVLALYAALWYAPHQAELARMATFYRVHQMQPHTLGSLWLNIRRGMIGGERGVVPYLLALAPVPCGLAAWRVWKRQTWKRADTLLTAWLACGLGFCLLSSYAPSRYYVLFLPPLAGLAAHSLTKLRPTVRTLAIGLFLLTSAAWYGAAWAGRTYEARDAGRQLTRTLPPGSVMVGEFAPTLCLNTPFAAAPVQPGLSNDDRPVERLKATQVAVTRTPFWLGWWAARYPNVVQPSHRVATFDLGGARHYVVDVYAVKRLP